MIHTHTPRISPRFSALKRLAALAGGLLLTTLATAGNVTITGSSAGTVTCAWGSVSGDGTNITYSCGQAQSGGPGVFTLSVPASLPANATGNTSVSISRSGGTIDATVGVSASGGGCTASSGSVAFVGTDGSAKAVTVNTTTGTCTITMSVPSGGTVSGSASGSATIVDPAAPVTLAFAAASISPTTFGASSPTVIKVNRSGGTNGQVTLPITVSGVLTNAAAGTTSASAGSTTTQLVFPANSSEASISFTPASTGTPGSGTVTLQAGGASTQSGQTVSYTIGDSRTFLLNASSGCVVGDNVTIMSFGVAATPTFVSLTSGYIAAVPMPAPLATSGYVTVKDVAGTNSSSDVEIWFSKCPGAINDPLRDQTQAGWFGVGTYKPCRVNLNFTGGSLYWNRNGGSASVCQLSDSGGPYYMNYRLVNASSGANTCPYATCPNFIQWNISTP